VNRNLINCSHTDRVRFSTSNAMVNPILTNGYKTSKTTCYQRGIWTPSNASFLGPTPLTIPNRSSIISHFLSQQRHKFPLGSMGCPISTPKIAPSCGAISTPSTLNILGPTWPSTQIASKFAHPFFYSSLNRPTDRQTRTSMENDLYQ